MGLSKRCGVKTVDSTHIKPKEKRKKSPMNFCHTHACTHIYTRTNIINDVGGRKVFPFEKWHFGCDAACLSWIMQCVLAKLNGWFVWEPNTSQQMILNVFILKCVFPACKMMTAFFRQKKHTPQWWSPNMGPFFNSTSNLNPNLPFTFHCFKCKGNVQKIQLKIRKVEFISSSTF